MKWSKLKMTVESRFSKEIRGRVALWRTCYRKAHDNMERGWITLDGREIWRFRDFLGDNRPSSKEHNTAVPILDIKQSLIGNCVTPGDDPLYHAQDLGNAMHKVLRSSIDDIIASENPIERALGLWDSRCGSRRLALMPFHDEHLLVKYAYVIRMHIRSQT